MSPKRISKGKPSKTSKSGITTASSDDKLLTFSFRHFDHTDVEVCPDVFENGYTQALMQRLRDLSSWKVSEFTGSRSGSIRSHPIDWETTSRPDGFAQLNEQFSSYTPYQFSVSSNAHGRVHGFLMAGCFNVVWLDANHKVYP